MPGLTIPHRRRRGQEDADEEDDLDGTASQSSDHPRNSKRVRHSNHDAPSSTPEPVLPNGYLAGQNGTSFVHKPGSIVRVKLTSFITYTAAEFFPGPSLNMVIGPNGTGKSALVCAICLGLGSSPIHLGRAREIGEFVKHGFKEADVEIELAGGLPTEGRNPIIRRNIRKEKNESHWYLDGHKTTATAIKNLVKEFSIQIDNLCQFLPQDRVVEFAALTPEDLLVQTQRAAAPEYMQEMHEELKKLRETQRKGEQGLNQDRDHLTNLEGRQNMQRADVERMQEREGIKETIAALEKCRPFAAYRIARLNHMDAKEQKRAAQEALRALEKEVAPSLRAVNLKKEYRDQIARVVTQRKRLVERSEGTAEDLIKKFAAAQQKIDDCIREGEAERNGDRSRKQDVARLQTTISRLKSQMAEEPPEFDAAAYNEQIRDRTRRIRDIETKAREINQAIDEKVPEGRQKNQRIEHAQRDLDNLRSQVGQQGNKLRQVSQDTARAWEWIQNNKDIFGDDVYGPPLITCCVKDPRYVDVLESLLQRNDVLAFTCKSRNDFKKLQEQLYGTMRLSDIALRTVNHGLDDFKPPVSEEEMRRYGLEGWALDYMSGPEPVLAMLCDSSRLNSTGVVYKDISDDQFAALERGPISNWVTSKSTYTITRRREYGDDAKSTRVRDVRRAQYWTTQPVDLGAERELKDNIFGWGEELQEIQRQVEALQAEKEELKQERDKLQVEKADIERDKNTRQKALGDFNALPTKLAAQEHKLKSLERTGADLKRRMMEIRNRQEKLTLEKGQLALDHAIAVENLRRMHVSLYEAEIRLIEATSDVETLTSRNMEVTTLLENRQREVRELEVQAGRLHEQARKLLAESQRMLSELTLRDEEIRAAQPDGQTPEDLEIEIESQKARLELVHEGNPGLVREFEERQRRIDRLREKVTVAEEEMRGMDDKIRQLREKWEPELDALVGRISDAFADNMERIKCAGTVTVHKEGDDFENWAIHVSVKFREQETLSILDSHRQSGGERAVSTIFYLMSLQSLARAPFRVVDEINQGMDPRNERLVHSRMVEIACGEDGARSANGGANGRANDVSANSGASGANGGANGGNDVGAAGGSQYFLITPKLLRGLKYHERMKVHCIASGEYMPADYRTVEFRHVVKRARELRVGA